MPFDFDAAVSAPFRMQPGLRPLAPGAAQLTPNIAPERGAACHLREKLAVLQAFPTQALLARAGFDAQPALDALARHAAQEQPEAFAIDATTWRAPILGWAVDAAGGVHELAPDRTPWPAQVAGDALAAQAWWRTERQSFIPVPAAQQAVFTIHVEVQPLALALADPARAQRVHDALASMSPAVLAYRGLADVHDRLLGWLAARSTR